MPIVSSPIPAYQGSVFISYARADDEQPPFDKTTLGWVTFFCANLQFELSNAGVHQAELWLDRYKIEPTEQFTSKIADALSKAALFVPILSPNWVQRPWCRQEIASFVELHKDEDDKIVLVKKREAPEGDIPPPLLNREGYKFFVTEPTGIVREFYWRGLKDEAAYFHEVKRIAEWIAQRFIVRSSDSDSGNARISAATGTSGTVYLAAPTEQMRDAWWRLANDLTSAGYEVLPTDGKLPKEAAEASRTVRAALGRCQLIVHLIGEGEGDALAGSSETLARMQLRLGREHNSSSKPVPTVLWAPKWLPDDAVQKRDPFEVLARFGPICPGEEVYGEEVTNLSQWMRSRLQPSGALSAVPHSRVDLSVIAASPEDNGGVNQLANRLQAADVRVRPVYAGAEPAEVLREQIALLVWGAADGDGVGKIVADLWAAGRRAFVLRLPGGDLPAKNSFFIEGVIVEDLSALPGDRRSARLLLEQLGIAHAPDGAPR
ncbi:toll/interleukin-1 receptor domain-containing protein [Variovorax sp. J22P240]|uniref:toll/interleukin-1 receptor domain-containing protein n=1 Tax=Variovorax sp. J22P240 TaxID=3053514 RepID=UPI0025758578|nr:toll/interleukin-1 receptor domain-containing protein [Variovorax sp. J22P240]MDM0002980.1 toll/interleukin-1 receptor domain-containing protein [Variovorax sp. J22P240]